MPFLLAIPAGEGLLWLGGATIAALGWYAPGGGRDQVEKALTSRPSSSVMETTPAQQSEQAKDEAAKESGNPSQTCQGCAQSASGDPGQEDPDDKDSEDVKRSKKGRLKEAGLPTQGRIRFVPRENWNPNSPLTRGQNNGYIDRFGNEWVKGPSRTAGEPYEWDVQLSQRGAICWDNSRRINAI